ncbi:MAG: carboxymuconolactone decarboxylase family protein [Acidocella sp.]|nr:carboxymuconolactone decarboxylase family protein [Acidocella sp.]
MTDRLPPLPDAYLTPAQRDAKAEIINGPRGVFEGPFIPLLRSPDLMNRLEKVGEYLRFGSVLPPTIRELAILMVARAYHQQTEWAIHHPIAHKTGLAPDTITAISQGRRPPDLSASEQAAWDFLTELEASRTVSTPTFAAAAEHFSEQGVIDLTTIAGYYATLAMIMNIAQTPPPAGERLP